MEDILKQILNKLEALEKGQEALAIRQVGFEKQQEAFGKRQEAFEKQQDAFGKRQEILENKQDALAFEQSETRKEVAFYYGSMMKKIDESKKELSSEIKQLTAIQKEHQNVLEYLNEKQ